MAKVILGLLILVPSILPVAPKDTADFIRERNYPVEKHTAVTQDGYVLSLFRIPYSPRRPSRPGPKPAVLFFHGLMCSSDFWVIISPEEGLPFLLADEGYDVWLTNSRGNTYSRKHLTLSPNDKKFWQFDWHEIGVYDATASIDFILSTTGEKAVHYVGHSQGCTAFLAMLSMRPEYGHKVKTSHLLAPVAFMSRVPSKLMRILKDFYLKMPDMETFYNVPPINRINKMMCSGYIIRNLVCRNIAFMFGGYASPHLNMTLMPLIAGIAAAGVSTRQIKHYAQLIDSGRFALYDFGAQLNLQIYRSPSPPDYPLRDAYTQQPIEFYYSDNDAMSAVEDVEQVISSLPNARGHRMAFKDWGHIDFIFAYNLKKHLNNDIINTFNTFESRYSGAYAN
ncbi:lipase 3-like [Drosophila guanche]|uniref:Lipase n=1 Tax=Drosophila guanche TaxID=7266 RepID=A0A3B0K0P8_DROGU|nr:lipase 3-like [Drosophila guanche]SPP87814.1 blast:Lipase 3 [Drosophila guanche]